MDENGIMCVVVGRMECLLIFWIGFMFVGLVDCFLVVNEEGWLFWLDIEIVGFIDVVDDVCEIWFCIL